MIKAKIFTGIPTKVEKKMNVFFTTFKKGKIDVISMTSSSCMDELSTGQVTDMCTVVTILYREQ
ncbi:MAG TPA: hypothetical protein VJI66_01220 [Candidatus Paceibacterota bacterium]